MWIITRDLLFEEGNTSTSSRIGDGSYGSSIKDIQDLQPHVFRLRDDDGNIYYHGLISNGRLNSHAERALAPLDWAMADAGCTTMEILVDNNWEVL